LILHEQLSEAVIGSAIEVHRALGPGLLESAYALCMRHELELRGIPCQKEIPLPILYKGLQLEVGYRMDLVVDGKIVVELKSVETLTSVHEAQLLTYLKLSGLRVGFLFNFNCSVIRNSMIRRVL
jgi:GxxExxY protein